MFGQPQTTVFRQGLNQQRSSCRMWPVCFNVGCFYIVALTVFFSFLRRGTLSLRFPSFTVKHFSLVGWEYRSISNCKFHDCVKMCKSERACISVNFEETSQVGNGCCSLNGCGVEDREQKGKSLVFTPNCVYHQLRPTESAIIKVSSFGFLLILSHL